MRFARGVVMMILSAYPISAQPVSGEALSLREAESLALQSSVALRIQGLQGEAAEERYRRGIRDYLPQLQIAVTAANTVNLAAPDSTCDELSVTVRQPVYNGGRTARQRALSRLQIQLNRHSYRAARAEVLSTAWDEFHQVLVLEAQLAVKRRHLEQSRGQLAIASSERSLGMIREVDLVDTELQASNQELAVRVTEGELLLARYSLKKTLGLPPDHSLLLSGAVDADYEGFSFDCPPALLLATAEEGNLDLQRARFRVAQAETVGALARSRCLPQISANLTLSVSGERLPLQTPGMSFGLTVAFPESDTPIQADLGGAAAGSRSTTKNASLAVSPFRSIVGSLDETEARLELEAAREALEALQRDVAFQVVQGIAGYGRQQETVRLERRSIELERRKLEIMRREVATGAATRVDYVKEEAIAAELEAGHLASILTLLRVERSFERLLGLDPGGLARLAGGGHDER